ncbi:623_t:CDS:2, partial [Cetraspora pellucida]
MPAVAEKQNLASNFILQEEIHCVHPKEGVHYVQENVDMFCHLTF